MPPRSSHRALGRGCFDSRWTRALPAGKRVAGIASFRSAACAVICAATGAVTFTGTTSAGVTFLSTYRATELAPSPWVPWCGQLVASSDPGVFTVADVAGCGDQVARSHQDSYIVPGGFVTGSGQVLLLANPGAPIAKSRSSIDCRFVLSSVATIDIDGVLTATGDFETRSTVLVAHDDDGASEPILIEQASSDDDAAPEVPIDATIVLPAGEYRFLVESFASRVPGTGLFFGNSTFEIEALFSAGNTLCPADLSADGMIDGADLGLMLIGWNDANPAYDLNGDGLVDGSDLAELLATWGACEDGRETPG